MVTAIITTYKREPKIVLRALDSILKQTYTDIEIIVVDDSPTDFLLRTEVKKAVLKRSQEYQNIEIRYIEHKKNMGACEARNTGMNAAKGEYVAYLDDDDEWLPTKIEKQVELIQSTNVALVYCGSLSLNEENGICKERKDIFYRGRVLNELLNRNFIASTSYPLIKKECLMSVGGFDPLMQAAQDYDVWLRLAELYEMDYVDEPLVIYHDHGDERITTNIQKRIKGTERLSQKFQKYLMKDRLLWQKWYLGLSRRYAANGDLFKALKTWFICVIKCPEKIVLNAQYIYFDIIAYVTHKVK